MENDKNLYGLEYYRANFRKAINIWIRFEGDTSVGEKTGGSFTRTVPNYRIEHDDQPADVEIIKNDGSKFGQYGLSPKMINYFTAIFV